MNSICVIDRSVEDGKCVLYEPYVIINHII